jgi:DNA-directed RNA polymerase subunit RPC12/RpoP
MIAETITCPYGCSSGFVIPLFTDGPVFNYYNCNSCQIPFVAKVEIIQRVTVHKIEGIEPTVKSPEISTEDEAKQDIEESTKTTRPYDCTRCGREFHAEVPLKFNSDIVCSDCFDELSECDVVGG